jgi:hypothetical protein
MNITYLLGAGASYNALPVVNQINDRLLNFANALEKPFNYRSIQNFWSIFGQQEIEEWGQSKKDVLEELRLSVLWLINENGKHFSIDTFAKKLYLQQDFQNLHKLKITLCCFFVYLQNDKLDNRYDSFFASILDDINNLPENLKFISWNYDYQLEIAFSNFIRNRKLSDNQRILNVCSKGINSPDVDSINKFGVFKLNGTTSLIDKGTNINILDNIDEEIPNLLNEIVQYYYFSIKKKIPTTLSFAWEIESDNYIESVANCIAKTDVLIVIGYSFPFFNRKIDSQLLDKMEALRAIYVQDPLNSESILERIQSLLELGRDQFIKFHQVKMSDQFYIPFEF